MPKRVRRQSTTGSRTFVGGIARHHLGADRPPLGIDDEGEHHLRQIGPEVLRVTAPAQRLAARAIEAERGGIHEHQAQVGKQVPAPIEQLLLDLFAQPGHGPVEVVQRKILGAVDGVALHPVEAQAVRARHEQPVQRRHEHSALDGKAELAPGQQVPQHLSDPEPFPQPVEQQRTTDPARRDPAGIDPDNRSSAMPPTEIPSLKRAGRAFSERASGPAKSAGSLWRYPSVRSR